MAAAPTIFIRTSNRVSGYDRVLAQEQLLQLQGVRNSYGMEGFCRNFLMILARKEIALKLRTRLIPFRLTRCQIDLQDKAQMRNIVLKPRQIGSTTWHILCRLFVPAILTPGTSGLLISQTKGYGAQHFRILQRALRYFGRTPYVATVEPSGEVEFAADLFLQHVLHTQYSARHEIVFDFLDSKVLVDCLGSNTPVFCFDGSLKKLSSLKKGDVLVGSDGLPTVVTGTGWKSASQQKYKGKAYRFRVHGLNGTLGFTTSPNHRFLTQRGEVEAKDIIIGQDYFAYPKRSFSGRLNCLPVARECFGTNSSRHPMATPTTIELTRETGFACGLYLAEGSIARRDTNFRFYLSGHSERYLFHRAHAALGEFIGSWKVYRRGQMYICTGKNITRWLLGNFGAKSFGKRVPAWVWDAPREFAIGLLEGWLSGDGCTHRRSRKITGVSVCASVAFSMRELSLALGLGGVSIRRAENGHSSVKRFWPDGRAVRSSRARWDVTLHGHSYDRFFKLVGSFKRRSKLPFGKIHYGRTTKKSQAGPKFWKEDTNFIYYKVRSRRGTSCKRFFDISVTAHNHLYCLPFGVTHNTAENDDAGTGLTINNLVATEVAFWKRDPEALLAQAKEAIPFGGTLDIESTPNGLGGYFYEEWQRAGNEAAEFRRHFYPWWWEEEYQSEPAVEEESLSEQESKMKAEFSWTLKQIAWRRSKQISLRAKFPEKYPEDDQTCFLTSGDCFFDRDILRWIKERLENTSPLDTFRDGTLKIYRRRIKGRRYLIGADVAEGKLVSLSQGDFSAAVVLDIDTGEEMAAYRSKQPPEQYAQDLVYLAEQYNNAVLVIERNGPGGTVITECQKQLRYGNIFYFKEWHKELKKTVAVAGFPTNMRTRPIALNKLAAMLRDTPEFWHDQQFIVEALNFVWRVKSQAQTKLAVGPRIPCGAPGVTDDAVMARAVAALGRLYVLGYWDPVESPSEKYGDTGDETDEEAA